MFWLLALILLLWAITRFYLRGENLSAYDQPRPVSCSEDSSPSAAHGEAIERLGNMTELSAAGSRRQRLKRMREYMDAMGDDVSFDGVIIPVDRDGLRGEWLVPANADPARRMLYIHGGAFMMGSPRSHRAITSRYAALLGGPVFSLDYRLMPEHARSRGIEDCRSAYRMVLEEGPEGAAPLLDLFVSGDSAGGNLVLMLSAWVRDEGLRAPSGVIALSPTTDATFTSPSLSANLATDVMLAPAFGKLMNLPRLLLLWMGLLNNRCSPAEAKISPVMDDLSGLPPTLVHASSAEMLFDDAVRYTNKAVAAGSPVELEVWDHMLHVWHIFNPDMPEAEQAFARIDSFMQRHRQAPAIGEAAA